MKEYADYSNVQNAIENKRLVWTDEREQGVLVEAVGIAASTKDSLKCTNMLVPSNRMQEQCTNAHGPFSPPQFTQTLKLKSVLKGSKDKYQLIIPKQSEKQKRPMSCGGTRVSNTNNMNNFSNNLANMSNTNASLNSSVNLKENPSSQNISSNVSTGVRGLKQLRNNFANKPSI